MRCWGLLVAARVRTNHGAHLFIALPLRWRTGRGVGVLERSTRQFCDLYYYLSSSRTPAHGRINTACRPLQRVDAFVRSGTGLPDLRDGNRPPTPCCSGRHRSGNRSPRVLTPITVYTPAKSPVSQGTFAIRRRVVGFLVKSAAHSPRCEGLAMPPRSTPTSPARGSIERLLGYDARLSGTGVLTGGHHASSMAIEVATGPPGDPGGLLLQPTTTRKEHPDRLVREPTRSPPLRSSAGRGLACRYTTPKWLLRFPTAASRERASDD